MAWLARLAGAGEGGEVVRAWLRFADLWPLWAVLAALLLIAAAVWWAYRPARGGALEPARPGMPAGRGLSGRRRWLMAGLRAAVLLLLLFVILQPLLAFERTLSAKPRLVVLLDDSQSMTIRDRRSKPEELLGSARAMGLARYGRPGAAGSAAGPEASAGRGELLKALAANSDLALDEKLSRSFALRPMAFGPEARPLGGDSLRGAAAGLKFEGTVTDLGKALRSALEELRGQPGAGIVVFSDGASNRGEPPVEAAAEARKAGLPVFTVGLGLPEARDLQVAAFISEDVVFINDTVPVYARLRQRGYSGETVTVELRKGDEVLARQSVQLGDDEEQTVLLRFTPKEKGEAAYRLEVEKRPDELLYENNLKEKRIKVIDEAIKVLIVEQAPRWDFRFLKGMLLRDKRVKLSVYVREADGAQLAAAGMPEYLSRFPGKREELFKYDLVILGDVPASAFSKEELKLLEDFVAGGGGGLCFASGVRYNPSTYKDTPLEPAVPVVFAAQPESPPEVELFAPLVQPYRLEITREGLNHPVCRLAPSDAGNADVWRRLPTQYWHFPATRLRPAAVALAVHSDARNSFGKVPLIAYQYYGRGLTFYLGFDSTWRWRDQVGSTYFARFWGQTINFLSLAHLLGESKRVQISTDRPLYAVGDEVKISARLLDKGFRPVEAQAVTARVALGEQEPREVELRKVESQPGMFAGEHLAAAIGEYTVTVKGEEAEGKAVFAVAAPRLEFDRPAMDAAGLQAVAERSGGRYFDLAELDKLPEAIARSRPLVTEPGESTLWDRWAVLILIVLLLAAEWLVRKTSDLA
jgi:hypothetical protein